MLMKPSHVSYEGSDELVAVARAVRRLYVWRYRAKAPGAVKVGGKNIAIVMVHQKVFGTTKHLAFAAASSPTERLHSEPAVLDALREAVRSRMWPTSQDPESAEHRTKVRLPYSDEGRDTECDHQIRSQAKQGNISLFTERAPCGRGPGMTNCAAFLQGCYPEMPVSYSYHYPSSGAEELNDIYEVHKGTEVFNELELEQVRQYWADEGKEGRLEVTKALKGVDKSLEGIPLKVPLPALEQLLQETLLNNYNLVLRSPKAKIRVPWKSAQACGLVPRQ